jgi:hypothetical protein
MNLLLAWPAELTKKRASKQTRVLSLRIGIAPGGGTDVL